MNKENKISLNEFMDTFIALCFINGNSVLNADALDSYLKDLFNDEYNENIINEYINKNILIPVKYFEYVLKINDKISTDTLLEGKKEYIPLVKQCVHEYIYRLYMNQRKTYETTDDINKSYLRK